ncbi:MAG: glutathione S-transferase family protein [Pseudomonadales bacterium]|nr:glutathione S-transferase family protein [Pseudomonadales bacterium]
MGQLVNGQWSTEDQRRVGSKGEFVRPDSPFRSRISSSSNEYAAESGRYHLFVNAGCPWAYRTLLYRKLKSLEQHISISLTRSAAGTEGWTFGQEREPLLNAQHIHDVYTAAEGSFTGRCTVPVLWDKTRQTIVNNESAEIIRMLNSAFDVLPGVATADYYPESLREEIDELNELIYRTVNNGVYRCGFAQTQTAYEKAYDELFDTLDLLDHRLSGQRYLCGESVTEADWRLFATLIRFDMAYYGQFRCNRNMLQEFTHLWPYTRDLYQHPGVAETVDFDAIKGIYFGSRPPGIVPKGPQIDFQEPHQRGS